LSSRPAISIGAVHVEVSLHRDGERLNFNDGGFVARVHRYILR
jgi:hypothetical protein